MAVTLFTLFVADPEPVYAWLAQHGGDHVIRKQAKKLPAEGWNMKVALGEPELCERFRTRWADALVTFDNMRKWQRERHGH
jgi:hypothetical protein